MTTQQILAIKWLTLLGAVFLSIAVPVLLISADLGGERTLAIFAPGFLVLSPVHNVLPALIVAVVVDAIVYCAVAYFVIWAVLRIMQSSSSADLAPTQIHHDAQQSLAADGVTAHGERLSIINAADRLSKLEFSADQDWETYPDSTYTCPHCGEEISFGMRDFEKHRLSQFTNLSLDDARVIAAASPAPEEKFNSFVDFYCPGCRTPVRILYFAWTGGRYTHGYTLSYVIERRT